jgi:uncharacterized membrane protein
MKTRFIIDKKWAVLMYTLTAVFGLLFILFAVTSDYGHAINSIVILSGALVATISLICISYARKGKAILEKNNILLAMASGIICCVTLFIGDMIIDQDIKSLTFIAFAVSYIAVLEYRRACIKKYIDAVDKAMEREL